MGWVGLGCGSEERVFCGLLDGCVKPGWVDPVWFKTHARACCGERKIGTIQCSEARTRGMAVWWSGSNAIFLDRGAGPMLW